MIEETLSNCDWVLGRLAADAEIAVERINELLEGDRAECTKPNKLKSFYKAFRLSIVMKEE